MRLNSVLLNNQEVTEEIKEIKNYIERTDNENTTQNLWDAAKPFTAIQS